MITRTIRTFIKLPPGDRALAVEAFGQLSKAYVITRFRSFEVAVIHGSLPLGERPTAPAGDTVRRVVVAVNGVADRLPFRALCFQRGLAVQSMLRRRGIDARLHYGVGYGAGDLSAHVWVSVDGVLVIGEEASDRHARLVTTP